MFINRSFLAAAVLGLAMALAPLSVSAALLGDTVETNGDDFTVEVREGKLIRLDRDVASIFIANPDIADVSVKSSRLVYIFGKVPGETSLYALDGRENVIANIKVVVHHNLSRLQSALDQLIGPGLVTVQSIDGGIIMAGDVVTGAQAEDARRLAARFLGEGEAVINQLRVTEPNQINIRVRFAEVTRDIVNEFGFDTLTTFDGAFDFALSSVNPFFNGANNLNAVGPLGGGFDLNILLDALATDSLANILAEPNLTALSGETASFLAGGEFPIPVAQDDNTIPSYSRSSASASPSPRRSCPAASSRCGCVRK